MTNLSNTSKRGTCKTGLLALCFAGGAAAQTFSGFTSGNLVVTRSVYSGTATTVTVGQSLPPVCPTSASCGKGKATDTGAFPATGSTGSVWNNSKPDGSFSVNAPIFLDQITPTGTVVNTLAVPPNLLTAAFNAKLELAVNLSADGSAITLMGYMAPVNTLDVADSNTPGVYDPTNPAGGSYYRGVLQVGANGAMRVTPVDAFSGTNGRAVMLAGVNTIWPEIPTTAAGRRRISSAQPECRWPRRISPMGRLWWRWEIFRSRK